MATHAVDTLVQAQQAVVVLGRVAAGCDGVKADAVVGDGECDQALALAELDANGLRLGVLVDVPECLLGDAVQDRLGVGVEPERPEAAEERAPDPGSLFEVCRVLAQRCLQTPLVEHGRAKFGHHSPKCFHLPREVAADAVQELDPLLHLARDQPAGDPVERVAEGREVLDRPVVELYRHQHPLVLCRMQHPYEQRCPFAALVLQALLCPADLGQVDGDRQPASEAPV